MSTVEQPPEGPTIPPAQPQYGQPQYGHAPAGVPMAPAPYPQPMPYAQPVPYPHPMPPAPAGYRAPMGPVGQVRSTWMVILLSVVTLGIYGLYYYYAVHEEMKKHSGEGLGGVLALVIAVFVSVVSPFLLSNEVGNLYARQGRPRPVAATTALWYFPGVLILVGPLVWLIKTNGALNAYWRGLGAQ